MRTRLSRLQPCFSQFDHAVRVEWCTRQGDHTHTWPECGRASMLSNRAWQRWLCVHESLVSLLGDRIAVGWVAGRVTTAANAWCDFLQCMHAQNSSQAAIQLTSLTVPCPGYAVQIIHMGLHDVHVWLQKSAQTHSTPALPAWW